MEFNFYLGKDWSSQNRSSWTVSAGPGSKQSSQTHLWCLSVHGVGAVISHITSDESEKPNTFVSHTLTKPECNYSQLEKEALFMIFGNQKFHQYFYGRKLTLVTDHKPLVTILNPRKGILPLAAA